MAVMYNPFQRNYTGERLRGRTPLEIPRVARPDEERRKRVVGQTQGYDTPMSRPGNAPGYGAGGVVTNQYDNGLPYQQQQLNNQQQTETLTQTQGQGTILPIYYGGESVLSQNQNSINPSGYSQEVMQTLPGTGNTDPSNPFSWSDAQAKTKYEEAMLKLRPFVLNLPSFEDWFRGTQDAWLADGGELPPFNDHPGTDPATDQATDQFDPDTLLAGLRQTMPGLTDGEWQQFLAQYSGQYEMLPMFDAAVRYFSQDTGTGTGLPTSRDNFDEFRNWALEQIETMHPNELAGFINKLRHHYALYSRQMGPEFFYDAEFEAMIEQITERMTDTETGTGTGTETGTETDTETDIDPDAEWLAFSAAHPGITRDVWDAFVESGQSDFDAWYDDYLEANLPPTEEDILRQDLYNRMKTYLDEAGNTLTEEQLRARYAPGVEDINRQFNIDKELIRQEANRRGLLSGGYPVEKLIQSSQYYQNQEANVIRDVMIEAERERNDEMARRFEIVSNFSNAQASRQMALDQLDLQAAQTLANIESQAFQDYLAGQEQEFVNWLRMVNLEQAWYQYEQQVGFDAINAQNALTSFLQGVLNPDGSQLDIGALGSLLQGMVNSGQEGTAWVYSIVKEILAGLE